VVEALFASGADVYAKDNEGASAVMFAAQEEGHTDNVGLQQVESGAKITAENNIISTAQL